MKKIFIFFASLIFSASIFAQVSTNPSDSFYLQVERWDTLGLLKNIPIPPQYKPYPLPVVDEILTEVINSENETESAAAQEIYESIHKRAFKLKSQTSAYLKFNDDENSRQIYEYPGIDGDVAFTDSLSLGYQFNVIGTNTTSLESLPLYSREIFFFQDMPSFGPVKCSLETDGMLSYSKYNFYLSTGINHSCFGFFNNDSIVLAPESKHTPSFNFTWRPGAWQFSQTLLVLSATSNSGSTNTLFSNKYFFLHSVGYTPVKNLNINFYEVSIMGGRIDPSYLIPMLYIVTEGISGYDDNILMGLNFNWKPVTGLSWTGDFFLDDIGLGALQNDAYDEFDIKLHAAAQTGLSYVPSNLKWLSFLKADYTLITPYMYSHWQENINSETGTRNCISASGVNYQEYTTAGSCLGSSLDPNSDRIQLKAQFVPLKNLTVDFTGAFIRHGNVNEGLTTEEQLSYLKAPKGYFNTDGTLYNHTFYWKDGSANHYLPSAWNKVMFLTQDTLQYTTQIGTKASYTFPKSKAGVFTLSIGYTFEYIKNYGVNTQIFTGLGTFDEDGNLTYDGGEPTAADVETALENWRASLYDVANHYININFKYVF